MVNYSASDLLIRIKNAVLVNKKSVEVDNTLFGQAILATLKKAKFVADFEVKDKKIEVKIAFANKKPVISNIKIVSKPGLRIYQDSDELSAYRKPSTLIITTPQGVMTGKEAVKKRLGGEVIAEIL